MKYLLSADDQLLVIKSINGESLYFKFKKSSYTFDSLLEKTMDVITNKIKYRYNNGVENSLVCIKFKNLVYPQDFGEIENSQKQNYFVERIMTMKLVEKPIISPKNVSKKRKHTDEILSEESDNFIGENEMIKGLINDVITELINKVENLPTVRVILKTLTGKTKILRCNTATTVNNLKMLIQLTEGIPPDQQRLICQGRQLEDGRLLSDDGVHMDSTIQLVLRLRGGMMSETSGRNGNYEPLTNIFYDLTNDCFVDM